MFNNVITLRNQRMRFVHLRVQFFQDQQLRSAEGYLNTSEQTLW
jgi:hypothetical protein